MHPRDTAWDGVRTPRRVCHSGPTVNFYFAEYAPDAHGVPLDDVSVREGEPADIAGCGRLAALREGGDPAVWAERLERVIGPDNLLFVATAGDRMVGYGRLSWLTPQADGGRRAPDGWYLSGVVVDPSARRQGVGRALTRARCVWVWGRKQTVYYVANAGNRASIDLHREIGFYEVTRDFAMPGVTFSGEAGGVLFAATESSQGEQVVELRMRSAG